MAVKNTAVGLDIGRHSAKAVRVEYGDGGPVVRSAELLRLPQDAAERDSVLVPWVKRIGIGRCPCVVGLRGDQAMFQPLLLNRGDPRTLEQAASMEVVKFNEMASETMSYAFAPFTAQNAAEKRMILAMARPAAIDAVLGTAGTLGLGVVDVVPTPVALFNALEFLAGEHSGPYLYLGVGASTTELAIGNGRGLMFARAFSSGGRLFSEAIAEADKVSLSQAENLKLTKGSVEEGSRYGAVLRPVADLWVSEIQSSLSVYTSLFPGADARPVRIVMTGGASRLGGFVEYVSAKLGIEAVSADSLDGGSVLRDPMDFAVAAGLGICGAGEPISRVSLLPAHVRDELMFRHQKPFWVAAGVAAALILAVSLVGGYRDFSRKERQLNAQKSSLRHRQQLVAEIERIKATNAEIIKMGQPIRSMLQRSPTIRDLISLVAKSRHPNDWIAMICDSDLFFSQGEDGVVAKKRGRGRRRADAGDEDVVVDPLGRIMIEGYTMVSNLSTVKDLIGRIAAAEFVESADLLGDDVLASVQGSGPRADTEGARRFVIDVRIRQK
jgi:general secretion pathway protein L